MTEDKKLASAIMDISRPIYVNDGFSFQFNKNDIDRFSIDDIKTYAEEVRLCRFFYKRDPLASTVINKLIDFALTDIKVERKNLSNNEYKIYTNVINLIKPLLEEAALEYLVTGMAVCEISYGAISKKNLKKWGIKKYDSIVIPTDYWVRDSETIIINKPFIGSKSTYSVEIPSELIYFIQNNGIYSDGTKDIQLYEEVNQKFPLFVALIKAGETKVVLEDPVVIERRKMANSAYPIPYLHSALESLKYKRALRKMDYALAARVTTAWQLITLGDKDFPLLEEDEDKLEKLRAQINYNRYNQSDYDRVYQLFGNHTLKVSWIMPDVTALLNDTKYKDINLDILFALGFPRILITGETDKSNTSNAEYAMLSPEKTMASLQHALLVIVENILDKVAEYNNFDNYAVPFFKPVNLKDFVRFFNVLYQLHQSATVSRKTLTEFIGIDFDKEIENIYGEKEVLDKLGIQSTPINTNINTAFDNTTDQTEDV